jgi:hypothetical protein
MTKQKQQLNESGKDQVNPQMRRWLIGLLIVLGIAIALSVALKNPIVGIAVSIGVGMLLYLNLNGKR